MYDAAEMLRGWHFRLTGQDRFEERYATVHFGPARRDINRQLYGAEDIEGNRAALPGILDRFGLYPWKVFLITEGEGDPEMLEEIVRHHRGGATYEQLGIVPHVMSPPSKKWDARLHELLGALRRFPNVRIWVHARQRFVLYVIDRDGTILDRTTGDHTQAKQRALSHLIA